MTFEQSPQDIGTEPIVLGDALRQYVAALKDPFTASKAATEAARNKAFALSRDLDSEARGIEAERIDAINHAEGNPDPSQDEHIRSLLRDSQEVEVERLNLPPI